MEPTSFRWPITRDAARRYIVIPVDVFPTESPRGAFDAWTAVSRRFGHAAHGPTPNDAVVGLEDWVRSKAFDYRQSPHFGRDGDNAFECGDWCEKLPHEGVK